MTETPENERPAAPRNEERDEEPRARVRAQPFSWVWLIPIGAAAIVIWLAWRNLSDRGPAITISFRTVDGLQAGQTKIQHRNVDLGTVESLELTPDMSHVIVHARMTRQATDHLTANARFAIIAPHVGVGGISGLSTIVSGSYIEMYPGNPGGESKREFVGLDEPPVLPPDSKGRSFTLLANDLGSLTRGSPISYKGITIGEVEDYTLRPNNKGVTVTAFIRSPHEDLVHPQTRFWNAGGVDLTLGSQGLRIRANSWEQLLSGGIAFETPTEVLNQPPSTAGSVFGLYDNRRAADRAPLGPTLVYVADFTGNQRGLDSGTAVELQGIEVGEVTEAHLFYDEHAHTLVTRTTFYVDPERVQIKNMLRAPDSNQHDAVQQWIEKLVGDGMRAQVSSASFLTGIKLVGLEMVPDAPKAHLEHEGDFVKMPSSASGDFTAVLQNLQNVLKNIDRATAGPQLGHALQSLDDTLTRLDKVTHDIEPDIKSLIKSLRDTADSAQNTLNTIQGLAGNTAPSGTDLPRMMRELTEAARSVRGLADYLDRHPEALIRGRKGDDK
ncbi:MAG: paraquat-inducible protein [Gammaproteobacteria bacterium]|jgi:paraquat-inducible protein B|nr:paraquat-inducible protein [Gammaproteobacteria bacterium]